MKHAEMPMWPLVMNEALMNFQEGIRSNNKDKSFLLLGCTEKNHALPFTGFTSMEINSFMYVH